MSSSSGVEPGISREAVTRVAATTDPNTMSQMPKKWKLAHALITRILCAPKFGWATEALR